MCVCWMYQITSLKDGTGNGQQTKWMSTMHINNDDDSDSGLELIMFKKIYN